MITKVPANPPTTSAHRKGRTFSPSDIAAIKVTISGVIITMAVNSPTGMFLRPKKASKLLQKSKLPRSN